MSPKATALLACTVLPVLLGACDALSPTEPKAEKTAATQCEAGPYLIHLSGQCRVAGSRRIVCEDETTTTPREKVLTIVFQLRSATTGTPIETRSIDPGAVPREVSFSGVTAGSYEIRHTVQARDCATTFTTYAGLDLF
jgi:hypothetical protein